MKTRNLLQTVLFILAFVMMNQVASAYKCYCKAINFGCKMGAWDCAYFCSSRCSKVHGNARMSETTDDDVTALSSIYPNPASNETTILFSLEQAGKASLKVFDMNGRLVKLIAEGEMEGGAHEIEWNAGEMEAGVYVVQFQSAEFSKTEKLVVTK